LKKENACTERDFAVEVKKNKGIYGMKKRRENSNKLTGGEGRVRG
jgi:hypothetical protein